MHLPSKGALLEGVLWTILLLQTIWLLLPLLRVAVEEAVPTFSASAVELAPLVGQQPFGQGTTPAAVSGEWKLFGIRLSSRGNAAILARANERQQAYSEGDTLAPGVLLTAVAADHVVLDSVGNVLRIPLPSADGSATPATPAAAASSASAPPSPATAPPRTTVADVDPARLLTEAGLRSVLDAGSGGGYALLPRGNDALLKAAGLQAGDVLVSVNGQSLDAERLAELAGQLKDNPRAVITYRRDGQLRSLTLGTGTR